MSTEEKTESPEALGKKQQRMKILYGIVGLLVVLDIFAPRHHPYFFWDRIPGFSSLFGFISCLILIFFSKGIGHAFLMKRKDYYND